jgi:hypothetical protein
MTQQAKSPYVKIIGTGPSYEYGHTEFNMKNRRKDRDIPEGVADTYEMACTAVGIKPRYLSDEMLPPVR